MKIIALLLLMSAASISVAHTQSLTRVREPERVESYKAWIGRDDLYNSGGARLTKPWQIIRQDRANFHAFGIKDEGDQDDSFFADAKNREGLEAMLARGSMGSNARRSLLRGNCWVKVDIFGDGDRGEFVDVEVWD